MVMKCKDYAHTPTPPIHATVLMPVRAFVDSDQLGADPTKHDEIIQNGLDIFWDGIKVDE
jgi:hypothetical protein